MKSFVSRRSICGGMVCLALGVSSLFHGVRAEEKPAATVQVTIDYGDGVQKVFKKIEWKAGLTAFDALTAAEKHPRGIKVMHQGKGETTLVTAIDDRKNEGRGNNWTYEVGGKLGDRSAAVFELQAGDIVLWKFGPYQ